MASKAPPPIPEEYKGTKPPPPPPSQPPPSRSRPNSVKQTPPPAPPRISDEARSRPNSFANRSPVDPAVASGGLTRTNSSANRAAPPTPTMAEREDMRHASVQARPPVSPKNGVDGLNSLDGPKPPLIKRKLAEYRRNIIECQKSKHALERALICAVAVALLWITCLALCQAIVNAFIRGPGVDKVIEYGNESIDKSSTEKASYDECATRLTTGCSNQLEQRIVSERARIAGIQAQIRANFTQMYAARDGCRDEVSSGIAILERMQQIQNSSLKVLYPSNISLTDPRCLLIEELLKGGRGGIQALGTTDRYVANADRQVDEGLSAIDSRNKYDRLYLINKTADLANIGNGTLAKLVNDTAPYFRDLNSTYDLYMACVSPTMTYKNAVCPSASVLAQAEQMRARALERYQRLEERVRQWENRARAVVDQINSFYNSLRNNPLLRAAIDVVLILQGLPSLEGMGFNLIGNINFGDLNFAGLAMNPTPDQMFADFEAQSRAYADSINAQAQSAAQQQAALLAASLNFGSGGFPPYNPPPINSTQRREAWKNKKDPMVREMATTLDNSEAVGDEQKSIYKSDANVTNVRDFSSTYLSTISRRLFGFYVYDGLNFEDLNNAWNRLISTALAFDYAWRVLRTLQIIRKYWRVSAIDLPPADVRTDHMQKKGLSFGHQNTGQRIAMCLAHPATACITLFIMTMVIAALLVALYLPLYRNFLRGCVDDGVILKADNGTFVAGPGTMISNNAYALTWSYTTSSGDRSTTVEVDRINARRQVVCSSEEDQSQQIYDESLREWEFIFRSHRDLQYQAFTMRDCLNLTKAQSDNPTAATLATSGRYPNVASAVPGFNCSKTFAPVADAVFDCNRVTCSETRCSVKNDLPDEIRLTTWRASCAAEWHIHSTLIGSILVIVVYISVNLSRIFAMRGLVRVFWRYLSDGKFSYLGTCDRLGELRYPKVITEEGYSLKRAVRESLAVRLKWWESKSFGILIFGLLINVPWIAFLIYFGLTLRGSALLRILAFEA